MAPNNCKGVDSLFIDTQLLLYTSTYTIMPEGNTTDMQMRATLDAGKKE